MRVLTVIGNRPQFIKAAAVSDRLRAAGEEVLVHTGQHYDDELSRVFFDELGLPRPEHRLEVGGGSNSSQTSRMLAALEPLVAESAADAVLVYGDHDTETPPELGTRLEGLMPRSRLVVLRGFDHWNVLTDGRHQIAHQLGEFLKEVA